MRVLLPGSIICILMFSLFSSAPTADAARGICGPIVSMNEVGFYLSDDERDCTCDSSCTFFIVGTCTVDGSPGVHIVAGNAHLCEPAPKAPTGVESCAVAGGYPGQSGVVIDNADGTKTAYCVGIATPAQCSLGGYVWNNTPVCVVTCRDTSPGAGWTVGAMGVCTGAPWVSTYPAFPGCPPAATVGIIVYDASGTSVFSVCL